MSFEVIYSLLKVMSSMQAESVDSFLESLGLEKYSITFQAEEVCKSIVSVYVYLGN